MEEAGNCSVVVVNFYDSHSMAPILEGWARLPVDCLPNKGDIVTVAPYELGPHDETKPGEHTNGRLHGVVEDMRRDYFHDPDSSDTFCTVSVYIALHLYSVETRRWAKSHGFEVVPVRSEKALTLVRTQPCDRNSDRDEDLDEEPEDE